VIGLAVRFEKKGEDGTLDKNVIMLTYGRYPNERPH
jgi:hypothetical protein